MGVSTKQIIKTPKDFSEVINPEKLKTLKNAADPNGQKGSWMKFLSDRQLAEVYFRLCKGEAPHSIVKMCQREWKIFPKSQTSSLARTLRKFKSEVVGEIRQDVLDSGGSSRDADKAESMATSVAKKIDALKEYAWLISKQKTRIELMITAEGGVKLPYEFTDKAMKNFKEMLDGYAALCFRLGVMDAVPTEMSVKLKHQFDQIMNVVVKDDKSKMIQACDKLSNLIEDSCILLKQTTEGTYTADEDDNKG